jgi:hypothetical protein
MDIKLGDSDKVVVEYYGLMSAPEGTPGSEIVPEKDAPEESVRQSKVRVAVIDNQDQDYYCVLWQYIEGNGEDIWHLMFRDDKLHKVMSYWESFITDLITDYGHGNVYHDGVYRTIWGSEE